MTDARKLTVSIRTIKIFLCPASRSQCRRNCQKSNRKVLPVKLQQRMASANGKQLMILIHFDGKYSHFYFLLIILHNHHIYKFITFLIVEIYVVFISRKNLNNLNFFRIFHILRKTFFHTEISLNTNKYQWGVDFF